MSDMITDFPILKSELGPKTVPAIIVYMHEGRCSRNHGGQTVNRLAERGGLNWPELFAVLHEKPFHPMNEQEAYDGCMAYINAPETLRDADRFVRTMSDAAADLEKFLAGSDKNYPKKSAPSADKPNFLQSFPVLGDIGPKTIPAKFVYAHSRQCHNNHRQNVYVLAQRGGLDWTELYAVLHDTTYRAMNVNDAMDLCLKRMEDPYQIWLADRIALMNEQELEYLQGGPEVPRYRCVWLNLADGSFSESWPSEESPPTSVLEANYTANDENSMFRLIEYRCPNKPAFAFDSNMRLR